MRRLCISTQQPLDAVKLAFFPLRGCVVQFQPSALQQRRLGAKRMVAAESRSAGSGYLITLCEVKCLSKRLLRFEGTIATEGNIPQRPECWIDAQPGPRDSSRRKRPKSCNYEIKSRRPVTIWLKTRSQNRNPVWKVSLRPVTVFPGRQPQPAFDA
jgi:hypothetical protein